MGIVGGEESGGVVLVPYADGDLGLTVALESDPAVKVHLGGRIGGDEAEQIHRSRLARMGEGELFFTIVVGGSAMPVGVAGVFRSPWNDGVIYEAGVMLLPAGSSRGIGLAVLRQLAERARAELRLTRLHGFTAITNEGGNTICRKLGWRKVGECDLDYVGRALRCNHWTLELTQ